MSRKVCHRGMLVGIILFTVSQRATSAGTVGSISGSVQQADGTPVANATVYVSARAAEITAGPLKQYYGVASTGPDGQFRIGGVPPGKFAVCPAAPKSDLLPPCVWGSEPTINISAGESATMPAITMVPGVDLYLRVNDPSGTRAAMEGTVPGAGLFTGVRAANGRLVPIPRTATDKGGFDHSLKVPADEDLMLVVFSSAFALADETGAPISTGGRATAFRISSAQKRAAMVIAVSGRNDSR